MRIKHPVSFVLLMIVMVITAALAVTWNVAHMFLLAGNLGLLGVLRWVSHREGHGPV